MTHSDGGHGPAGAEEGESDRHLVQRTLNGDAEAFAAIHRRYYARVYRLALLRCRNISDAEDVAAETFVRAIAHLPSYRFQGESLFPWLARIATNLVADQGRRRHGTSFVSLDAGGADEGVRSLIEGLASDAPDPHALAERQEVQALLRAAIGALPSDQADAVALRFIGDLPLKEIAAAMGRTEGAIKSLLHRALVNLRKSLTSGEHAAAVFGHTAATFGAATTAAAQPTTAARSYER
jgi:RNA polymerase sigma-70 factor (ECF subfamily)